MSAVTNAISDTASSVSDTVGSVASGVGDAIVNDVAKPIASAVDSTIQSAVNDPIGTAAKVAAVATGNPELLPLISGADTMAHGGSVNDALASAGTTYVAGQAGAEVGGDVAAQTGSQAAGTAAGGAAGGVTGAALRGGDVGTAALAGAINATGNSQLQSAASNIGATPGVAAAQPTSSSSGQAITGDYGMSPSATAATDWASIYAQPSTDPTTGATTTPVDQSAYPNQDLGNVSTNTGVYSNQSTGTPSTWQTVGGDMIQVQDDGTAIGVNTETGETYSLGQDQVTVMEQNGLLNSAGSGYVGAISGSSKGTTIPLPGVNFAGALLGGSKGAGGTGGSGGSATLTSGSTNDVVANPSTQYADLSSGATKATTGSTPDTLNPLLFKLAFNTPAQSKTANPFSDVSLGTSLGGPSSGNQSADPFDSLSLDTSLTGPATQQAKADTKAQPTEESSYFAQGGLARMHPMGEPQFYSEGGLGNRYTQGKGDGTSDEIPAMLANNEFVMPADVVAALGNGSSDAGASKLDQMIQQIRKRARSTSADQLPPPAHESPLDYLKGKA